MIGALLLTIGITFMICFFMFVDFFEKINDTLCFILVLSSIISIIWGLGIFVFKTPEEHFKEQEIKKSESIKLEKYKNNKPIITIGLIIINIIMFIAINIVQGNDNVLNYAISRNNFEFYKVFTSMFSHVDESHIFFNMLVLFMCGSKLEAYIGKLKYLSIYLISGIGSSILSCLVSTIPCVGASGAIFGILGCSLMLSYFNRDILQYTFKYDLLPNIIISLLETFLIPHISIPAHVGGLLIGIIMYFILCRKIKI